MESSMPPDGAVVGADGSITLAEALYDSGPVATLSIGQGGKVLVAGVEYTLTPRSGDGMGALLRNGVEIGRAALVRFIAGAVYARSADGGWKRWYYGTWRTLADIGPDGLDGTEAIL